MARTPFQQFVPKVDDKVDDGDFNAACSMLYRWWSLLEAPEGTDTAPLLDGLLDKGARVPSIDPPGKGSARAWSVRDEDIELEYLGEGRFRLRAPYLYQAMSAQGITSSGRGRIELTLRKLARARMVIAGVQDEGSEAPAHAPFEPTWRLHRIKAVLLQWQAHMDTLSGDASGLRELVMPQLEFHGLIAAKVDHSTQRKEVVKDFTEMKGMLAGTDGKEDTVIRGFDGVERWFATGPNLLKRNIHRAEQFRITPISDERYGVVAQFGWYAQTLNGVDIELHQPLEWVIVERGEKYMRLERLRPHQA